MDDRQAASLTDFMMLNKGLQELPGGLDMEAIVDGDQTTAAAEDNDKDSRHFRQRSTAKVGRGTAIATRWRSLCSCGAVWLESPPLE